MSKEQTLKEIAHSLALFAVRLPLRDRTTRCAGSCTRCG